MISVFWQLLQMRDFNLKAYKFDHILSGIVLIVFLESYGAAVYYVCS